VILVLIMMIMMMMVMTVIDDRDAPVPQLLQPTDIVFEKAGGSVVQLGGSLASGSRGNIIDPDFDFGELERDSGAR
jgi:hypothetical protein